MAEAAETLTAEQIHITELKGYNHELRLHDNTTTWLAETLDGGMRTEFDYAFDGRELYGHDGGALKPIFKDAITDAERLAVRDPSLRFEVRRRYIEDDEREDMMAMARGDKPNTMVVVSDFPSELMEASRDIGGYNVRRKQTMLRIITKRQDGTLVMRSQSLDRSNRQALEAIYGHLGYAPLVGELLSQRMYLDFPAQEQEFLADWLTDVYDRSLSLQYGGEWHAGRTPAETLNTYEFVSNQSDLVGAFVKAKLDDSGEGEKLRYGLAAAMEKRFNQRFIINPIKAVINAISYQPPWQEMIQAGQQAMTEGKSYSGCGISIGANNAVSTLDQLNDAGYGNQSDKNDTKESGSTMYCVSCPKCRTFHDEVKSDKGVYKCKNKSCDYQVKA